MRTNVATTIRRPQQPEIAVTILDRVESMQFLVFNYPLIVVRAVKPPWRLANRSETARVQSVTADFPNRPPTATPCSKSCDAIEGLFVVEARRRAPDASLATVRGT